MELSLGNIFVAVLLGLPGYIALKILNTYAFSNLRFHSSKTNTFLLSVVFSLGLFYLYDIPAIRNNVIKFIFQCGDVCSSNISCNFLEPIKTSGFFPLLLKNALEKLEINSIELLLKYCITPVIFLTLLLSTTVAFLFWIARKVIAADVNDAKANVVPWILYGASLVLRQPYAPFAKQADSPPLNLTWSKTTFADNLILLFFLGMIEVFFGVVKYLILLPIFYILDVSDRAVTILARVLHTFLALFRHPYEKVFDGNFSANLNGIPIIEIRTGDVINKGVFCGFITKDSDDLEAITIRSVIQYRKKRIDESFHRRNRTVYPFPLADSMLTIPANHISDFNFSHITLNNFNWTFSIEDNNDVYNQLWYITLLMKRYPSRFSLENVNANVDVNFSMQFFAGLLKAAIATYKSKGRRIHFSRVYHEILRGVKSSRNYLRQDPNAIDPAHKDESDLAYEEILKIRESIRKFKRNRN